MCVCVCVCVREPVGIKLPCQHMLNNGNRKFNLTSNANDNIKKTEQRSHVLQDIVAEMTENDQRLLRRVGNISTGQETL